MKIIVVGSINMDLVVYSQEIPKVGETVMGDSMLQNPGGKGANQAVAIAKLGTQVGFLGKVGEDHFGEELLRSMKEAGVDTGRIEKAKGNSGMAIIHVDAAGNNNIVVIAGANQEVDEAYLEKHQDVFSEAKAALFQLEIPLPSVEKALGMAKGAGVLTVLNPAPAMELRKSIYNLVDVLIPNEYELSRLRGKNIENQEQLLEAARYLLDQGVGKIIVTLGSKGVLYVDREGHRWIEPYEVKVVDTTAAGDSFIGGFLSSYIGDDEMMKAIDQGQKAAALTIQRKGAQQSLPTARELAGL